MPQNQNSGAEGNRFGHEMAARVAEFLGTELISENSNEIIWEGKRFVIKSAHKKTSEIGVTANTLERVQGIIAAIENQNDNRYTLYIVELNWYKEKMTPSHSHSHASDKVMKRSCNRIKEECKAFATIL